ncbi:MAG TPA: GGDEF domain-containing protein [Acetobacteraceae bacterium]|jgi:diguanylate cyclase (GGDEF)-like protein|nr:GGDEF domain-containing protein [Acetobacteraceae bacterium]
MPETSAPARPVELPAQSAVIADGAPPSSPGADRLRDALLDSRERWRDLAVQAADFAFETDEWGRLVFVAPDPALGWPASTLIGQPADLLLADDTDRVRFNPFRVLVAVRRRRAWLKRGDGGLAGLIFAVAPLLDQQGRVSGTRGIGLDFTECDGQVTQVATALRRGEVLDHILWRMGQEVLAPRMICGALEALANALGAEGAAVILIPDDPEAARLAHEAGGGAAAVLQTAAGLLHRGPDPLVATQAGNDDGRRVAVAACQPRFGDRAGLAVWRNAGARPWDTEDRLLVSAAANLIRFALEHEAIQREMARQARTDPLTGLLNRRAFMEEIERCTERLDREEMPGTLLFVDIDNFKIVNDEQGHEMGDQVLVQLAILLRAVVRPTDLVARLGGDEFAMWLNGADHMTAAERAEQLRIQVPRELGQLSEDGSLRLGVSIGIATRSANSQEQIDSLLRRADAAMYGVKREGRGHWRVAREGST